MIKLYKLGAIYTLMSMYNIYIIIQRWTLHYLYADIYDLSYKTNLVKVKVT